MNFRTVKLSEVKPNPNNPRLIKDDKFHKLVKSIQDFPKMLEIRPIVVNSDMIVLGGNMRLKACKEAGLKEIPIIFADDLTEDQQREFIIKDNVGFGEWDWEMIANEWEPEQLEEWGLDIPDFSADEVLEAQEDDFDEAPPENPITVLGDLYEIGEHRLLCGDSTDSDQVARLMNGEKADMVFTDPPYGIKVVKSEMVGADFGVAKKGKYSEVIADDTTDTAREFYDTCVSLGMDRFIIWGGNYFTDFLPFSDGWLIWNKRAGTDIRNTFADGEMAWCSFHTPIRIYDQLWNGMIREGEKDKRVHPTQKPIRMLSEIIDDHIRGKLIFDGFLGSGSTMVASHQLKRKCYGMELDPKYCDVIVRRMVKLDTNISIKRNGVDCKAEFE
jgi:DNA modification methylase